MPGRVGASGARCSRRWRRRRYGAAVADVVRVVWESLTPVLLPTAQQLARWEEMVLTDEVAAHLATISRATVQTDNGLEFQQRFHTKCADLGLEHFYIHKSSPNDNAVIERSFRTDEEECFFWLEEAPRDYGELNEWCQAYLVNYNTIHPHQALACLTPHQFVTQWKHQRRKEARGMVERKVFITLLRLWPRDERHFVQYFT